MSEGMNEGIHQDGDREQSLDGGGASPPLALSFPHALTPLPLSPAAFLHLLWGPGPLLPSHLSPLAECAA